MPAFRWLARLVVVMLAGLLAIWLMQVGRDAIAGRLAWWFALCSVPAALMWLRLAVSAWHAAGSTHGIRLSWGLKPCSRGPQVWGWLAHDGRHDQSVDVRPVFDFGSVLLARLVQPGGSDSANASLSPWLWVSAQQQISPEALHHLRALLYVQRLNQRGSQKDIQTGREAVTRELASSAGMTSAAPASLLRSSPARRS